LLLKTSTTIKIKNRGLAIQFVLKGAGGKRHSKSIMICRNKSVARNGSLKKRAIIFFLTVIFILNGLTAQIKTENNKHKFEKKSIVGEQRNGTYVVPTSQIIDPVGVTIAFPGRPVDLALNPDETILAVKNLSSIVFFDAVNQSIKQTLALPSGGNTFAGIGWSHNGTKVWTTDTRGYVRSAQMQPNGLFRWSDTILLPSKTSASGGFAWENEVLDKALSAKGGRAYPGGFAIDESKGFIYVTLNSNNAVGIVNIKTNKFEGLIPVSVAPYTVVIKNDKAYVTNWGGRLAVKGDKTAMSAETPVVVDAKTGVASSGTVSVINLKTRKVIKEIKVHLHPTAMVASHGSRLYVANTNSDLVSVINTETNQVIRDINPKPIAELPFGSTPNALAISADDKTLYVANGDNNLIAVIDLTTDKVKGLIPTGWYPGAVLLNKNNNKLFVANTKGLGSREVKPGAKGFASRDHLGSVSFIPVSAKDVLEEYTVKAATNMRLPTITQVMKLEKVKEKIVPVPTKPGEKSVFKHVIYIIKENKTYDQVFGGLKQGNGDSSLCQFGRNVTPNHHALAEGFVLLDNTYCNGVLSADGHQWADEGYVTNYLERSFGGFVRSYPYRGDDPLAFASSGFIWDQVLKKGLSFRNYGEFVNADITNPKNVSWKKMYDEYKNNIRTVTINAKTKLHTLEPYTCPTFAGFGGNIPDVYRAGEFIKELIACEAKDEFPNFITMLLPNDHTVGVSEGYPTPSAAVADNDLALGQIVEAVSKSKFWKETVIFVIQDDPQSGLDHVDGKRTVALCISPYTKRGQVISTQYNQNSVLRTIELILGLPPMTQFDFVAQPMDDCFTTKPNFTPYTALPNQIPLDQMNPKLSTLKGKQLYWAKKSMEMPLDEADEADDDELNKIIWFAVRGYNVAYPKY
jgi:YVTN family beta-propeller protein